MPQNTTGSASSRSRVIGSRVERTRPSVTPRYHPGNPPPWYDRIQKLVRDNEHNSNWTLEDDDFDDDLSDLAPNEYRYEYSRPPKALGVDLDDDDFEFFKWMRIRRKLGKRKDRKDREHSTRVIKGELGRVQYVTKQVDKVCVRLQRLSGPSYLVQPQQHFRLYCADHAELFAKDDEYDFDYPRKVKFIFPHPEDMQRDGIDLASIPGDQESPIIEAAITISQGGTLGTKLFRPGWASVNPVMVDTWSMGVLPITFISPTLIRLKLPRDIVLRETGVDPSRAPEFFEFVGIS